ncbi:MAG: hypothetical protein HYX38_13025 [Rhodospirillales bacterium]|nr:hypothetical protein [Rhodospirillales bacterium]
MPIHWAIDSRQELVVVTAEGDVTRADAEDYLDVIEGTGSLAIVDRPLRLFTGPTPARRWLEGLVPAQ